MLETSYSVKCLTQLSTKSRNAKFANVTAMTFFSARTSIIALDRTNASIGGISLPGSGTLHMGCFRTGYWSKWFSPFSPGFECWPELSTVISASSSSSSPSSTVGFFVSVIMPLSSCAASTCWWVAAVLSRFCSSCFTLSSSCMPLMSTCFSMDCGSEPPPVWPKSSASAVMSSCQQASRLLHKITSHTCRRR